MKRQRPDDGPGRIFHISVRVNWRAWHLAEADAREQLCALTCKTAVRYGVSLYGGVVLSNHYHSVVQSPPEDIYRRHTTRKTRCRHVRPFPKKHQNSSVISQFMREIGRAMSRLRQRELGLSGHFWEAPYDARPVVDRFGLVVRIAYGHRNPVRARMTRVPEEYPWSSARTWRTGEQGPFDIDLSRLPFGFTLDELRREVLHYQELRAMDDVLEQLEKEGIDWQSPEGMDILKAALEANPPPALDPLRTQVRALPT